MQLFHYKCFAKLIQPTSSLIINFIIGLEESVSVPPKWDIMRFDRLKPIPLPSLLVVKNGVNI